MTMPLIILSILLVALSKSNAATLALLSLAGVIIMTASAYYLFSDWINKKREKSQGQSIVVELRTKRGALTDDEISLNVDRELIAEMTQLDRDRLRLKAQRLINTCPSDSVYKKMPIESVMTSLLTDDDLDRLWQKVEITRNAKKETQEKHIANNRPMPSAIERLHQQEINKTFTLKHNENGQSNKHSADASKSSAAGLSSSPVVSVGVKTHSNIITVDQNYKGVVTITRDDEGGFLIHCSPAGVIASVENNNALSENDKMKSKIQDMAALLKNSYFSMPMDVPSTTEAPVEASPPSQSETDITKELTEEQQAEFLANNNDDDDNDEDNF